MLLAALLTVLSFSALALLVEYRPHDKRLFYLCVSLILCTASALLLFHPAASPESSIFACLSVFLLLSSIFALTTRNTAPAELLTAVRESEQRFRDFARSCSDNFWEMDHNLRFNVDVTVENLPLPWSSIGKTRWELAQVDPETDEYWRKHKEDLEAHLPFRDFFYSHQLPDGRVQHWKVNGMPVFGSDGSFKGYRGTAAEMTESIEARRRARESQRRLYNAIENISEGFVLWDADDRIVLCNSRYKELFADIREICAPGTHFEAGIVALINLGFFPLPDEAARQAFLRNRIARRKSPRNEPQIVQVKDNRWLQVIERRTADGGLVGIWTDITESKRREAELAHAQKLELVGQLTGSIAHDFNNFLAVILGNLEILKRRIDGDERLSKFVQRSITGAQRAAALTQRLLAFSRKQILQPRVTDLRALLEGMRELISGCVGVNIISEISSAGELALIEVDPNQLETALLNLVLNARDAMGSGGTLRISAGNADDGAKRSLPNGAPLEDFVALTVSDTGVGIPPELRGRVFEPFFTTKDAGKGSGLGLSMVDGFVRQSNGYLELQSEPGLGTRITLLLPKASAGAFSPTEHEIEYEPPGRGETILVLEDEKYVRELSVSILSELGYRTIEAGDGIEALQRLKECDGRVDMVLSDVVLPNGLSGPDFFKQAVLRYPHLSVVFMSGYPQISENRTFPEEYAQSLLHKPFKRSLLAQRIRQTLEERNGQSDLRSANAK